jgi:transcriptional regulator of met regulon
MAVNKCSHDVLMCTLCAHYVHMSTGQIFSKDVDKRRHRVFRVIGLQ